MRKLLLTAMAVAATSASFGVVAPGASAAVERCSEGAAFGNGGTIQSCVFVDSANGRAQALLSYDTSITRATIVVTITIQRSGSSATHTCTLDYTRGVTPLPLICNAFAANPPGTQAWRADISSPVTLSSPIIADT